MHGCSQNRKFDRQTVTIEMKSLNNDNILNLEWTSVLLAIPAAVYAHCPTAHDMHVHCSAPLTSIYFTGLVTKASNRSLPKCDNLKSENIDAQTNNCANEHADRCYHRIGKRLRNALKKKHVPLVNMMEPIYWACLIFIVQMLFFRACWKVWNQMLSSFLTSGQSQNIPLCCRAAMKDC